MIERFATVIVDLAPRVVPVAMAMYGAADADPEIAALAHKLDSQRLAGARALARLIHDKPGGEAARPTKSRTRSGR